MKCKHCDKELEQVDTDNSCFIACCLNCSEKMLEAQMGNE